MGKITDALKKAATERMDRIDKINRIKKFEPLVIKKKKDSKVDSRIVSYFDSKALITEQYKTLRTNVLSLNKSKSPKVIPLGEGRKVRLHGSASLGQYRTDQQPISN